MILVAMESPYDALELPAAPTVLATFGVARNGMDALADVLMNALSPSATLPVSFPASGA